MEELKYELLEKINLHNLQSWDGFLNVSPSKPVTKEKIDKYISSQWKTFVLKKTCQIHCALFCPNF